MTTNGEITEPPNSCHLYEISHRTFFFEFQSGNVIFLCIEFLTFLSSLHDIFSKKLTRRTTPLNDKYYIEQFRFEHKQTVAT